MKINSNLYSNVIDYNKQRLIAFRSGSTFQVIPEYEKILNARYSKISRIKKRLTYLLTHKKFCWFCTFTFDNYYIKRCDRTKKDLIKSCLKNFDFIYILNIDYGSKTEREHYHCIVGTDFDFDLNSHLQKLYPCFCSALPIHKSIDDQKRLSKYINKLSNHCIKSSTNNSRIVYNFRGYDDFTHSDVARFQYLLDKMILEDSHPYLIRMT